MERHDQLHALARVHGIESGYVDWTGTARHADAEVIARVLAGLGVATDGDLGERLSEAELAAARELIAPVVVAWDGTVRLAVQVPAARADDRALFLVTTEAGAPVRLEVELASHPIGGRWERDGVVLVRRDVELATALPPGYHSLRVIVRGGADDLEATALLLVAPSRVFVPADGRKHFGAFLPLHALHSQRSLGAGNFGDLRELLEWVRRHGGSFVGTLPLLAAYLDDPCEPSPYVPCTRLAWNELYLDLAAIPELADCEEARAVLESADSRALIERLRAAELVDWKAQAALQRRALEPLSRWLFERGGPRRDALDAFAVSRPEIVDYCRFRAACERLGAPWQRWPERQRGGVLRDGDFEPRAFHFHLFAQWNAHLQLAELARVAGSAAPEPRGSGLGLYLDLPVGVHSGGFDTWRERESFAHGLASGAPPDLLFAGGQNWLFPPLHPTGIRAARYRHVIAYLRNHLRYAKVLRIDHVMGLHRLYVIPEGASAREGAYIRYRPDELWAIVSIESHRAGAIIIGEDLGTVPPEVHAAMDEHGVLGMHVVEYAASPDGRAALPPAPARSVASVNTHDMPPFFAWWQGADIELRRELRWIDDVAAASDRRSRGRMRAALREFLGRDHPLAPDAEAGAALHACLRHLAAGEAKLVLVGLEDAWGETRAQNVPGTCDEHPNWRGRARLSLEQMQASPELADLLATVRRARTGAGAGAVRHDVTLLSADDLHWFNEGTHERIPDKLGAHPLEVDGVRGTYFAVWAPSAQRVAVLGDFNRWDRASHPLRTHGNSGIWEGFVPGVEVGDLYKFHVVGADSVEDKSDPLAIQSETPPRTASVVASPSYAWTDAEWMAQRQERSRHDAPVSIYEVHLGSWMRVPEDGGRWLGYRELGRRLAEHVSALGFTHVELMPVMEHPFYGSWGYQVTGYFAPTARYGAPEHLMELVDTLHRAGIGVIMDWVPSHFPADGHGLARFDGTSLYEHADPKKGYHPDWHSLIFNYGRYEVQSFLVSSAMWWLERYHADGLRVDGVASMLYLDYSRKEGEWIPNRYGGRENLEAIAVLRRVNEAAYRCAPGIQTFAEESTAWPMVSRPTYLGGLGFGYKWDMGWMHDTLQYIARDPSHRAYHHHELTFRMVYAFTENFVLALSHDEVVHGKGSLLGKMPGDRWQRFANLRLLYGYMYGMPGKKLLFMGGEFAQEREWDHEQSLDWHLLDDPLHAGTMRWIADLNRIYRAEPALHQHDSEPAGFEWIDFSDTQQSVYAFLRRGRDGAPPIAVVCNFTPVVRRDYRVGVPQAGSWQEIANSDAGAYGGSDVGNLGRVEAEAVPIHGRPFSLRLTLPPLAVVFFRAEVG